MFVAFMCVVSLVAGYLAWPSLTSLWTLVGLPAPIGWFVASLFGHDDVAEEMSPDTAWAVAGLGAQLATGWVAACLWAAANPATVLTSAGAVALAFWLPEYVALGALVLVRGLPGAGKSTWAASQASAIRLDGGQARVVSADDWFMAGDQYLFNPAQLPQAHADCLRRAKEGHLQGETVFVANTFTQAWEMAPYLALDPDAKVVTCPPVPDRLGVHGVPQEAWDRMAARWEPHQGETVLPPQVGEWDNWVVHGPPAVPVKPHQDARPKGVEITNH